MEDNKTKKEKLPTIFIVLRVIAFTMIGLGIVLAIAVNISFLGITVFSIVPLFWGFFPSIQKLAVKTQKYVVNENKDDLSQLADTNADISQNAAKKLAKSAREGWDETEEEQSNEIISKYKKSAKTIFCKHCGGKIDEDSRFCKHCGKQQ